jgi:hypothetical protein
MVRTWQQALHRCTLQAVDAGHLRADTDADQLVYEMYGLILGLHHDARFLKKAGSVERAQKGFDRLIDSYRDTQALQSTKKSSQTNQKIAAKPAARSIQ